MLGTDTALRYVLYIQPSVRVIFITTDVIEILMMDGTLKLENFQPIQIGELCFIHAVSFEYFEDIGAYCTDFSVSCNHLLTDKISGIVLVLYVCCSFKCIISMLRIHILAEKVSLILLYVHWIVNMYFRHECMLYVYMYKHVIVILCNTVFDELFIIIFIINVFIIILHIIVGLHAIF